MTQRIPGLTFGVDAAPVRFVHETVGGDADPAVPEAEDVNVEPDLALARLSPEVLVDMSVLHATLARELGLPSYYGANWDALQDVLTDEAVLGERLAFVLILDDGEEAFARAPHVVGQLIAIALDADRAWRERGRADVVQLIIVWRLG